MVEIWPFSTCLMLNLRSQVILERYAGSVVDATVKEVSSMIQFPSSILRCYMFGYYYVFDSMYIGFDIWWYKLWIKFFRYKFWNDETLLRIAQISAVNYKNLIPFWFRVTVPPFVTHCKRIPTLWLTVTESCKFIVTFLTKVLCFSHERILNVPLRR